MAYKALTYVVLGEAKKAPGDTITEKELKDAGQTEDDVKALIEGKAIGDEKADIHSDHDPITIETSSTSELNVIDGEVGGGAE